MKTILSFIIALALGIGYLAWLDSGCDVSGVMTWHGKVCFEELSPNK